MRAIFYCLKIGVIGEKTRVTKGEKANMHAYIHVCVYIHICMYAYVYIYACMCIYIYACTCIYTYIYATCLCSYIEAYRVCRTVERGKGRKKVVLQEKVECLEEVRIKGGICPKVKSLWMRQRETSVKSV